MINSDIVTYDIKNMHKHAQKHIANTTEMKALLD